MSERVLHRCGSCADPSTSSESHWNKRIREEGMPTWPSGVCCSTLYEGLYVCKLHLWREALGQTRLVLCPGLERDHQSFTRLDQRRCCCSQLPQSFKAFCHLHPQSPGISLFPIAYPCHKDTRKSNLISALTQQNETLHFCHEVILSLLSSAAASSRAKKHNSNGKHTP